MCLTDTGEASPNIEVASSEPNVVTQTSNAPIAAPSSAKGKRKAVNPRSHVWGHFTKIENNTKCKCNYCDQIFSCDTASCGTSTLNTHLTSRCKKCPFSTANICKLDYIEFSATEMYDVGKAMILYKRVKASLYALYDEYKNLEVHSSGQGQQRNVTQMPCSSASSLSDSQGTQSSLTALQHRYKQRKAEKDGGDAKSELLKYLEEDTEEDNADLDVLSWWKANSARFPIVSLMARDILAIPISTVASESAFSTGGRVLDAFRSSLSPKIVEALICTQDWIRNTKDRVNNEENLEEIDKLDEGSVLTASGCLCLFHRSPFFVSHLCEITILMAWIKSGQMI